jgi:Bacterial transglutaminase-like N-terminal region
MMLRPHDDDDQKVLESELEIKPEPSHLTWTQDIFGNHAATARSEPIRLPAAQKDHLSMNVAVRVRQRIPCPGLGRRHESSTPQRGGGYRMARIGIKPMPSSFGRAEAVNSEALSD